MTREEIEAARAWVKHYGPHLRAGSIEVRHAVATAEFLLACFDETPEILEAAGALRDATGTVKELEDVMATLRDALARRPVLAPLHSALTTGEFLPLDELAKLGVPVYRRRDAGPRVIRGFDKITGKKY